MKRALVLYQSLFGNTKKVAMSLARGIAELGVETDCMSISEVDMNLIASYDFLSIGGPTHILRPSKDMKEFLERLKSIDLKGLKGFAFDTRNHSRMNKRRLLILENSAARSIEGALKKRGIRIIIPRESAIVEGREGPLDAGVIERFFDLGKELGRVLNSEPLPSQING